MNKTLINRENRIELWESPCDCCIPSLPCYICEIERDKLVDIQTSGNEGPKVNLSICKDCLEHCVKLLKDGDLEC